MSQKFYLISRLFFELETWNLGFLQLNIGHLMIKNNILVINCCAQRCLHGTCSYSDITFGENTSLQSIDSDWHNQGCKTNWIIECVYLHELSVIEGILCLLPIIFWWFSSSQASSLAFLASYQYLSMQATQHGIDHLQHNNNIPRKPILTLYYCI